MRFGLDFGTSNSALAVDDGGGPRVLPLDPIAGDSMPTVLYVRRDGSAVVGRAAIDAYLADSAARGPVRRRFTMLGRRVASTDKEQATVEAHIYTDADAPGRLFQSLKTFLGDPLLQPTNVFGDARGLADLVAAILERIRSRAGELTGQTPERITLGRPVEFVGGPDAEARAVARLTTAAELAGFRDVRFELEPVAAARAADVGGGLTLVFDFGGGTLDLCVVEGGERLAILATAGADVGGDRCTQLLIDEVVAPRLGSRAEWGEKRLALPRFIANAIGDWRALSALNEKPLLDGLDDLVRAGAPRREIEALRSAIELQLGYDIFSVADQVKCELSEADRSFFTFHRGAVDIDTAVSRRLFEVRIASLMERVDGLLAEVIARAGVPAERVEEVVCTGGSSRIPAARALLVRRFPGARLRDASAYTSVAAGLAATA